MTVSANYTWELNRDQLIRRAYQIAGLLEASQSPTPADLDLASDFLNLELDELQARGAILRSIERTTLTLLSNTSTYSLDADCIDVSMGPNSFAGTTYTTAGSETMVRGITRQEYMAISNKSVTAAAPTMVYVEKLATLQVVFWPVPSQSGFFAYAKVRLLKDTDSGTVTLDLARRWQMAITYAVARHVARAKGKAMNVVTDLDRQAEGRISLLLADDKQRPDGQLVIARY